MAYVSRSLGSMLVGKAWLAGSSRKLLYFILFHTQEAERVDGVGGALILQSPPPVTSAPPKVLPKVPGPSGGQLFRYGSLRGAFPFKPPHQVFREKQ